MTDATAEAPWEAELDRLRKRIDVLSEHALTHSQSSESINDEVKRLCQLIDGDSDLGVVGLRPSLATIQGKLDDLLAERQKILNQLQGVKWAAGFAGSAAGVNLLAIARQLFLG